ncbi:hypothetical protein CLV49_0568 [Labedella gwakjiensis]|uniref:Uncharacterized protein n=1 Tax=Labedella gwakjiensis TaxID=390269 RepID=A0A2P8GSN7_9MICO|nr:hypothetical protein [Labedella gwakjiensis]PSL36965.1 hypothetical protein CLV49_0568 [Labedella gwakjiensis]
MVAIGRDDRFEVVEHPSEAPAIAAIVHGLVFVVPAWTLVASVVLLVVLR